MLFKCKTKITIANLFISLFTKIIMDNKKRFGKILRDIKSIKIQGASNIARKGIEAFLLFPDKESAKKILSQRPTEPFLQNAIHFLLNSENPKEAAKKYIKYACEADKKISVYGASLVKNNMNIFTHCHSSTVVSILKYAKKQGKKFTVYNAETRPLSQGKLTAKELAKAGIKVIYLPDPAAEDALLKCQLFLFGADAYLKRKIINKTGTNMLCEIAKSHNIPRYSCGISLKYANNIKLETRSGKEVWDERSRNITIFNPAFSALNRKYVSGVVSEFGILKYRQFIKKAIKNIRKFH